jgi:hypothetical protein
MRSQLLFVSVLGLGASLLGACGGTTARPEVTSTSLRRAQGCTDLLASLKADASRKMNAQIDAQIVQMRHWSDMQRFGGEDAVGASAPPQNAGAPAPSGTASSYSQTNVQVKGVDEADIVKNDGKYVYLLHGQTFRVVQAFPAADMKQASTIDIEGSPEEMFVDQGRVVVYSTVDGSAVLSAAGLAPRPQYSEGGYAFGAPACLGRGCGSWYGMPLTKITVLALDGTTPRVVRESWLEGSYVSSRRVGSKVRAVLSGGTHGPQLRYWPDWSGRYAGMGTYTPPSQDEQIAALEKLRAENEKAIAATQISDWLPFTFARSGQGVTASLGQCSDYWVPEDGSTQFGFTQIAALDLDAPAEPKVTSIVGAVDTVYSNTDTMVLAARAWMPTAWYYGDDAFEGTSVAYTHLHAFDLSADPSVPTYEGSATVPGTLVDQFSLDVKGSVLRVATTEQRVHAQLDTGFGGLFGGARLSRTLQPVNRLFTVAVQPGKLAQLGDVGELAPNERIYSARFEGDRGYLVTFRQVDPLFVLDLADARAPKVLGSLKIPGFSSYMHPLDAGHLLTIGRDADENTGRVRGLSLQIFDVTNPLQPALQHKYVFPTSDAWGYSEAEHEHKAFTYFPEKKLLAFPYYSYDYRSGTGTMSSTAELFRIDLAQGITHVGSVDHTEFFGQERARGYCGGYYSPEVRRAVFMDDVMYSISYGGVVATDTRSMSTVKVLGLDRPYLQGYAGCAGE